MSHYYDKDGNTAYTVIGANGKERNTTIRDARKNGYYPSVTTVTNVKDKSGLRVYFQNQLLDAVLKVPAVGKKEFWKKNVVAESKKHSIDAAKVGNVIHDALESMITGELYDESVEVNGISIHEFVSPVEDFLEETFPGVTWIAEKSFTDTEHGFGGRVDLHSTDGDGYVLDFKTKGKDDLSKIKAFDEHHMQSAAYAVGLGIPKAKRYNLFISTTQPGVMKLTESDNFDREWGMFKALLTYWQLSNKYEL